MQALFGRDREAAFFGHSNEVTETSEIHDLYLKGMDAHKQSLFHATIRSLFLSHRQLNSADLFRSEVVHRPRSGSAKAYPQAAC
jgi:hypothetical protein